MAVCGSSEANINWNLNPKYSPNTYKNMGVYLEYNSKKMDFNEKNIEKLYGKNESFFNLSKIYH